MELKFYGANCFRITTKKSNVVIDDNLDSLGAKPITKAGDIVLHTVDYKKPGVDAKLVIDQPGEYEVADISVQGVAAQAHIDGSGQRATMYKLIIDDIRIGVIGHIQAELDDKQLESLGAIDVLLIPVGNNGYTLDGVGALKLIKKIEPKIVIPSHYEDKALKYPVPQQSLEEALKAIAMEPGETIPKLKLKPSELGEATHLMVLERQ